MPAVTRSLRSSTRLSAAAPADEQKTAVEKSKAPAKTKVAKKEATSKTQTEEKTSKAAGAGRKRKADEAEPEDEPEPKAEEAKKPAAKKAKVHLTHIPPNHNHFLTFPKKPAAGKKEAPPRKTKDELKALRDASASVPDVNPDAERRSPPEERYWLMKSEPDVRIEDGYEIKFSIDDLAAKKTPEGWEGIRNYAARNNLRDMRKGDKAFFYHSNCKEPGIVGIISIVKEHSPD
ncbi:Thymocyte nuclear protein 1, partial [Colletotrichum sp. SAR11_59]